MEKNRVLPVSHALVLLLIHLGTGLAAPVLSLMLLARGATLATLPLVMGVTTAVTCLCEVPSGVAADVLGRRRVFALSMALQVATYVVLLATPSLAVVAISSILRGLALAARTGTLEAVELDRVVAEHTDAAARLAALDSLNGRLALLESVGVGAGAVAGGVGAALDPSYTLLIGCIIASGAAALTGGLALFPPDARSDVPARERLRATLADMRATLAQPGEIRLVLAASASAGVVMVAVETYWQLAFEGLVGAGGTWLLGFVSCAGMGAAALGSAAAMRWGSVAFGAHGRRRLYLALQAAAITCLALFSAAASVPAFVVVYVALYLTLGARSVIEQTVLHNAVPSRERSGMASVQSIALRAGGLAGSAASGPAVAALTLTGTWLVLAALAAALVALGRPRAAHL